ncbi:MAG: metallophosphoesterase family protein [Candidatus Poribacteria bacterium]
MKYLIISDIHSNIEALRAVIFETMSMDIDKYIILGDLVGYCANPNEVIEKVKEMIPLTIIRGNHDKFVSGLSDGKDFNYIAKEADLWTREILLTQNMEFLRQIPKGPIKVDELFEIVHGSHYDEDRYILGSNEALEEFYNTQWKITFFGHTHIQMIWAYEDDKKEVKAYIFRINGNKYEYKLDERLRYMINPGSVGQPRDRDPRSAFAIFDSDKFSVTFFRINYNIRSAQNKIIKAGLDEFLSERLAVGI